MSCLTRFLLCGHVYYWRAKSYEIFVIFLNMFFIFASHKNNYNHKEGISGPNWGAFLYNTGERRMRMPQEILCIQMLQKIAKFESFIDVHSWALAEHICQRWTGWRFSLSEIPTDCCRREKLPSEILQSWCSYLCWLSRHPGPPLSVRFWPSYGWGGFSETSKDWFLILFVDIRVFVVMLFQRRTVSDTDNVVLRKCESLSKFWDSLCKCHLLP